MTEKTRAEKIKAVAKAFMEDDPMEYAGETIEEVAAMLERSTSEKFIDHAYESFCEPIDKGLH